MRRLVALFAVALNAVLGYSQGGPEVLGAMVEKMGAIGSYRIDFELEMPSATATSRGYCKVDGERYVVAIEEMMQGSDGLVVWAVNTINQEVTLDTPRADSRSLFDNPTKAFDFAAELFDVVEFKDLSPEEWELVLRPAEGVLDGIDVVEVRVNKNTQLPTRLGYDMAGMGLYVNIRSLRSEKFAESDFVVPEPKDYEVIDFR